MKATKPQKRAGELDSLFTPEISKKLDEREEELANGKGIEISDLAELRKKLRNSKPKSSS